MTSTLKKAAPREREKNGVSPTTLCGGERSRRQSEETKRNWKSTHRETRQFNSVVKKKKTPPRREYITLMTTQKENCSTESGLCLLRCVIKLQWGASFSIFCHFSGSILTFLRVWDRSDWHCVLYTHCTVVTVGVNNQSVLCFLQAAAVDSWYLYYPLQDKNSKWNMFHVILGQRLRTIWNMTTGHTMTPGPDFGPVVYISSILYHSSITYISYM